MELKHREVYFFKLRAESPLCYGEIEQSDDSLLLPGNSIGGALREGLRQTEWKEACELYMGVDLSDRVSYQEGQEGQESDEKQGNLFQESKIWISDGEITNQGRALTAEDLLEQEGTAIDAATGAARPHYKYAFKYAPPGIEVAFRSNTRFSENFPEPVGFR